MIGNREVIYNYKKAMSRVIRRIPHIKTSIICNAGHIIN
ncbi:hypothetical protein KP78_17460 [Jeotgalibacillus soli]|uniref:Uncharacterized protein n=1 Tax=Jeotgalibacillus soli TaxID=889306 RepID=A0A0C2S2P7_9BACL|nr:hypothetical protein KP78_17460 [Jeotgalibacillus soli]